MKKNDAINNKLYNYVTTELSFVVSLLLTIIVDLIISKRPDVLDVAKIKSTYIFDIDYFVAEKNEFLQYAITAILFTILFVVLKKIFYTHLKKYDKKEILEKIHLINIFILTFSFFSVLLKVYLTNPVYTSTSILSIFNFKCIISILIILSAIIISNNKKIFTNDFKKYFNYVIIFILIIFTIFIGYLHLNETYLQDVISNHFDAYYYPVLKINSGLVPNIDFYSLYGGYAYIFSWIMKIFNNESIYFFSFLNSLLIITSFLSILYVLNNFIKNKIIVFITFLSIAYFQVIYSLSIGNGVYLQYTPNRLLFPTLILAFITYYLKHNEKAKRLQILGFLISSFSIFYNFETGIVVLGTWMLFLIYEILYNNCFKKQTLLKICKPILLSITSVIAYILFVILITFIYSSKLLSIKDVLFGQTIFFGSGYFMLKMSLWHLWIIFAMIYLISIALSLSKIKEFRKDNNINFQKNAIIFTLTILGVGIFSYFQGRSHNAVFLAVMYPGIMLIGLYLEILIEKINDIEHIIIKCSKLLFIITASSFLIIFSVSFLYNIKTSKRIFEMINKKTYNEIDKDSEIYRFDQIKNVVKNLEFSVPMESLYYKHFNMKDTKKFQSYIDIFRYVDIEKILLYLNENNNSLVTTFDVYSIIKDKYLLQLQELAKEKYTIFESNYYYYFITKDYVEQVKNIKLNKIEIK